MTEEPETPTPEEPETDAEGTTGAAALEPEPEAPAAPEGPAPAEDVEELEVAEAADEPEAEDEPAAPVPTATRRTRPVRQREPGERVVVRAHAKYVRSSARKARMVCDLIRGKDVDTARAVLSTSTRDIARDWSKLLESAVANAENNHELDPDTLRVYAVHADEGPTLKRFRPRAMGRATKIRKRTSHLTILLTPKE